MSKARALLDIIEEQPQTASGAKTVQDNPHPSRLHTWLKKKDHIEDKDPDIKLSGTESNIKYLQDQMKHAKQIAFYPEKEKLYVNGSDQSKFLVKQPELVKTTKMKFAKEQEEYDP